MADILTAPIQFAAGLPVALTETAINLFTDWNKFGREEVKDANEYNNLYYLTSSKLDMCALIYFYTELRSSTKRLLKEFADSKGLKHEFIRGEPSDIELLDNAISEVETYRKKLETIENPKNEVKNYQDSLQGLENLRKKHDLTNGDIEILRQYFKIISRKPKTNTDIKADLHLFHQYIDPLFRVSFGGEEFNIERVEELVEKDEKSYIDYIDDDFTKTSLNPNGFINGFSSEVVYAIVVSDKHKTISVVFRGSVNANDWISNIQVDSTPCIFPGFTTENVAGRGESYGQVHEGFYKYLFGKTKAGSNGSTKSKGEEIMGKIRSLVNGEKKGYTVLVTGHSLGGALSTLMATRAAALKEFDSTIINVSFASPFVGDQQFRDNFYEMEQSNRIKHLRVSNYEDVVPLIPNTTFPGFDFHTYKHVGVNLKLFKKSLLHPYHYHISYPKKGSLVNELRNTMQSSLLNGINLKIWNHLLPAYDARLQSAEEEDVGKLSELSLWELYKDSRLTGWEAEEDPETTGKE